MSHTPQPCSVCGRADVRTPARLARENQTLREALRDIENTFNCRTSSDWSDGYAKAMLREAVARAVAVFDSPKDAA